MSEEDLQEQLLILQALYKSQEELLQKGQEETKKLQAALQALFPEGLPTSDNDKDEEGEDEDDDDDTDAEMEGNTEKPYYDHVDGVLRCVHCHWEVVAGLCQYSKCRTRYAGDLEKGDLRLSVGADTDRENVTENQIISSSRRLAPRGTTPLGDGPERIHPKYTNRVEEYEQLIRRGATEKMCETFSLEFSDETGIVAWATEALFHIFSGPAMVEGDEWRIHLGRDIKLEKYDYDGLSFISGLLEDAMYYPLIPHTVSTPRYQWETVKDRDGIWVTKPKVAYSDEGDIDDDEELDMFVSEDEENEAEDEHLAAFQDEYPPTMSEDGWGSSDSGLEESDIDPPRDVISNARVPDYSYSEDEEVDELDPSSGEDELDDEDDEMASGDEEVKCELEGNHEECPCRRCRRNISEGPTMGTPSVARSAATDPLSANPASS